MTTGSVLAQFTITLSQAVSEQVAVEWHTEDGTAQAGVDYSPAKGTVLFAPGETSKVVDILVYGRAVGSEDRSFFVEMLPPVNAILGASIGECIIHVDTTGSTPVTQIIVPTGPQGLQGDSAYQTWLDLGNTGTEQDFLDSLKPSPEEIAEEVAPLLDMGESPVTAEGTASLSKPDTMTLKALARRVAYVTAAKIATVALSDGDNLIGQSDLTGDVVDMSSECLYPRIMRGTTVVSPEWSVESDGRLLIKDALIGDILYLCEYDVLSSRKRSTSERELWKIALAEIGLNLVSGSFEQGATVNSATDAVWHIGGGKCYTWSGSLPKTVGEKTSPGTTGASWVDRTGQTLRALLSAAGGVSLVNGATYRFGSAAAMSTATEFSPRDGDIAMTAGYYAAADGGGATYTYSAASTATVDGFLVHNCAAGGRWMLVDNRDRLPVQVAGAKVDGTTDDRSAFLAILASKRKVWLDGIMRISGAAIDLAAYITTQQLRFDIEGADPIGSQLLFDTGSGGLSCSTFLRGLSLKNIHIKNAAMDKSGVGFTNAPVSTGAEMVAWSNVTFTGWRCGFNLHAWNSTLKSIASRACYYAGSLYGTSSDDSALYAVGCNYAWALGLQYSGGLSGSMALPDNGRAFSYANLKALAADDCGPYILGRCYNTKISSMGAEKCKSSYVVDLSLYPTATARQNIAIECFDVYIQPADTTVTRVFGPIDNAYGSLKVENTNFYSDRSVDVFSGDARGIKTRNVTYNSSSTKKFTENVPNGLVITDELILGSDYAQLQKVGYSQGGFDQIRKVRAMFAMPLSATGKAVIRIQDESLTALRAQGVMASGKATFYPVRKSGSNNSFECGMAIFSVAADSAGAFSQINLQKLGSLSTMTATYRMSGTIHELALTLPAGAAVQYLCELEFWCNGKFASSNIDYYVES